LGGGLIPMALPPMSSTTAVPPREDRTALGVGLMALAVLFFTGIDTTAKWLILSGLPALQVVFARYAGAFLLSLVMFVPVEGWRGFGSRSPGLQFLRSMFLLGSTMLNFIALKFLPITLTTTIMFAGPVVVTLLSVPVLGERIGIRRLAAVVVGFVGVVLAVQPWGAGFHPAIFLSCGALVSASLYFVLTRLLAGTESNATSQIWSSGIATVCIAPFAFGTWVWPETQTDLAALCGIGAFGAVGHSLATIGHRYADASLLAPVFYLQLVFASVASVVVFGTPPTISTLAGAVVIMGSGAYIWQRERRRV
jgi:drug/metabolite transporter (DMT)-like permease